MNKRPTSLSVYSGIALAGVFLASAYAPLLFSGDIKMLMGRMDLWNYFAPMAYLMDASLHHGEWPQWNPLIFCGTPYAANPQSSIFYLPQLLRSLLNTAPTPLSSLFSLLIMQTLHLIALAVGMVYLCRSHRFGKMATATAILVFMGSGALAFRTTQHWHFIAYACWTPWLVLLIRRAMAAIPRKRRHRYILMLGWMTGLCVLIGFPQLTLYLFVLIGGYTLFHRLTHLPRFSRRKAVIARLMNSGLIPAVAVSLAIAMSMPSLLPTAELSRFSPRAKTIGQGEENERYQQIHYGEHPEALAQAAVFFGGVNGLQLSGLGAFTLALCVGFHRRRRAWLPYAGLLLIFLDCCFGPPFPCASFLSFIAPFRIAEPERAALFACFALAMLAGFAMEGLKSERVMAEKYRFRGLLLGLTAAALLLALLEWEVRYPIRSVPWIIWPIQLIGAVVLSAWVMGYRSALSRGCILVALALELVIWNGAFIFEEVKSNRYPADPTSLQNAHGFSLENRRTVGPHFLNNQPIYTLSPAMNGYDPLYIGAVRNFLCAPRVEDRYNRMIDENEITRENTRGYNVAKRLFWLVKKRSAAAMPAKDKLFPVSLIAPSGDAAESVENTSVSPEACTRRALELPPSLTFTESGKYRVITDLPSFTPPPKHGALRIIYSCAVAGKASLDLIADSEGDKNIPLRDLEWIAPIHSHETEIPLPDFGDPLSPVHLRLTFESKEAIASFTLESLSLLEDRDDQKDRIQITESGANYIRLKVTASPEYRWLTFTESAYPGWRASVDGNPVALHPAYGVFQAIELSEGAHDVIFRFRSQSMFTGLYFSLSAFALSLIFFGYTFLRKHSASK